MAPEITYLFSGIVFGLSGGLTPGPLLTLVVSQTLQHGVKEGIKVAIAPLLTDLPIVLAAFFVIAQFSEMETVLDVIAILGGIYLAYLGFESLTFKGAELDVKDVNPRSIRKGIIANFLNPNPYVFWLTVGGPSVLKALNIGWLPAALFIAGLYLFLVGSKVMVAILVGKSRRFLKSRNYIYTIRALGVVLFVFAGLFIREGLI
jgi:threonine/homoserine/homoserine lactone efflux protein